MYFKAFDHTLHFMESINDVCPSPTVSSDPKTPLAVSDCTLYAQYATSDVVSGRSLIL